MMSRKDICSSGAGGGPGGGGHAGDSELELSNDVTASG